MEVDMSLDRTWTHLPVRHCEAVLTSAPVPMRFPKVALPALAVEVEGPVMVKVLKSRRIWQMLVWHLHTEAAQLPAVTVEESKYVQFSENVFPQPAVTT